MIEFFKLTLAALGGAARTVVAQVRGAGAEGADDDAEPLDGVELVQPYGLFAWPVPSATAEVVGVRVGDEVVGLGALDKGRPLPAGMQQGEARVAGSSDAANYRSRPDGTSEVNSDTSAGKDVVVNGGTLPVARRTDGVVIGTLAGTVAGGVVTFTFIPYDVNGVPGAPVVGTTITLGGLVLGAAPHFKA